MQNDNEKFKMLRQLLLGKNIILATADESGSPNIIACEVNEVTEDGEIIITNNQMGRTVENIIFIRKAAILYTDLEKIWLRIIGDAEYDMNGKWFDFVKTLETNKKYRPKGALIIKIEKIEDIDKGIIW